ncbi:hypothetical protein A1F94_006540 [Pyrenophora tritici-repentis]|nr:hypothetical protein A1F94_006540 [Pyrenophora tritici-repentis]
MPLVHDAARLRSASSAYFNVAANQPPQPHMPTQCAQASLRTNIDVDDLDGRDALPLGAYAKSEECLIYII